MRITPNGVVYEEDPRHHESLTRSLSLENGTPNLTPGVRPAEKVTGRVSHASMDSSGTVILASGGGTDTVRGTELGDLMFATMQATSATEALSPKEKRNTVILQPRTQRHRNTSKHSVSFVNVVDVQKTIHIQVVMVVLLALLLSMSMIQGFHSKSLSLMIVARSLGNLSNKCELV